MVPWSHLRQPFSGWVSTVLNSEFTHFNSVIRLSNVQQLAFPFCTFCDVPRFRLSFMNPVNASLLSEATSNYQKPPFFAATFAAKVHQVTTYESIRQAHVLQVWFSSFWWLSGEVQHFVHLIRWNLKAVLCPCGWLEHGPVVAQSHEQ